jgi:alkylated DNA repair protein (DNA oxidative demethylase)
VASPNDAHEARLQKHARPKPQSIGDRSLRARARCSTLERMADAPEPRKAPEGLVYRPDFLSDAEEDELLAVLGPLEFEEIRMKGVVARRTALRFGMGYDYTRRVAIAEASPFPDWLVPVRDRAGALAGIPGADLVQALVQRYPEGAPIGWHRDSPSFELVVGVSLLSGARMRFRRGSAEERVRYEIPLEPRSAYVLAGPARWEWEHHVPPAQSLRYSLTFRSLRRASATRSRLEPSPTQ